MAADDVTHSASCQSVREKGRLAALTPDTREADEYDGERLIVSRWSNDNTHQPV